MLLLDLIQEKKMNLSIKAYADGLGSNKSGYNSQRFLHRRCTLESAARRSSMFVMVHTEKVINSYGGVSNHRSAGTRLCKRLAI